MEPCHSQLYAKVQKAAQQKGSASTIVYEDGPGEGADTAYPSYALMHEIAGCKAQVLSLEELMLVSTAEKEVLADKANVAFKQLSEVMEELTRLVDSSKAFSGKQLISRLQNLLEGDMQMVSLQVRNMTWLLNEDIAGSKALSQGLQQTQDLKMHLSFTEALAKTEHRSAAARAVPRISSSGLATPPQLRPLERASSADKDLSPMRIQSVSSGGSVNCVTPATPAHKEASRAHLAGMTSALDGPTIIYNNSLLLVDPIYSEECDSAEQSHRTYHDLHGRSASSHDNPLFEAAQGGLCHPAVASIKTHAAADSASCSVIGSPMAPLDFNLLSTADSAGCDVEACAIVSVRQQHAAMLSYRVKTSLKTIAEAALLSPGTSDAEATTITVTTAPAPLQQ